MSFNWTPAVDFTGACRVWVCFYAASAFYSCRKTTEWTVTVSSVVETVDLLHWFWTFCRWSLDFQAEKLHDKNSMQWGWVWYLQPVTSLTRLCLLFTAVLIVPVFFVPWPATTAVPASQSLSSPQCPSSTLALWKPDNKAIWENLTSSLFTSV